MTNFAIPVLDNEDLLREVESLGRPPKEVWKPDISERPDAIVGGKLMVGVGEHIVVQYPEVWRETEVWRVEKIYDENCRTEEILVDDGMSVRRVTHVAGTTVSVGHVRLYSLEKKQFGSTNYLTAPAAGHIVKMWSPGKPKTK